MNMRAVSVEIRAACREIVGGSRDWILHAGCGTADRLHLDRCIAPPRETRIHSLPPPRGCNAWRRGFFCVYSILLRALDHMSESAQTGHRVFPDTVCGLATAAVAVPRLP